MDRILKITTIISNLLIISLLVFAIKALYPLYKSEEKNSEEDVVVAEEKEVSEPEKEKNDSAVTTEQEIDVERDKLIKIWASQGLTNVDSVLREGKSLLDREKVSVDELKSIANRANKASNFVSYIQEEYNEYYRENYKYSFVQEDIAGPHDAYVEKANELKNIRNKAFYRLGQLIEKTGDIGTAFYYYRDAFRLSDFDTRDKGIRYKAEQEMKRLLGIEDIESYITWSND